jgi:nucleoside-diphosphate-sugar epimerase
MAAPDFKGLGVLVTGGAGFIGSHLVDALLARGAKVRVLDNFSSGRRENLAHCAADVELLVDDLRDLEACRRACEGASYVFHQAALGSVPRSLRDPATSLDVNVGGTAKLFTAARDAGVQRVVYASSSSVYGDSEILPKREGTEGQPLSPYALSKWMNEELASAFTRCFGMRFVGLRYFNIYGPRQSPEGPYAAVIPLFFDACRREEPPVINGDGEQSRDFTFVSDAVQANLLAAGAPDEACGRAYNIGAGGRTTVNELARLIREVTGASVTPEHRPPRAGDVAHSNADVSRALTAFGYSPSVALVEGIARTYAAL